MAQMYETNDYVGEMLMKCCRYGASTALMATTTGRNVKYV